MDSNPLSPPGTSPRESEFVENSTADFDSASLRKPVGNSNEVFPNIGQYRIQPILCFHSETPERHRSLVAHKLPSGKLPDIGEKSDAQHEVDPLSFPKSSLPDESKIVENSAVVVGSMPLPTALTVGNPGENSTANEVVPNTGRCRQESPEGHSSRVTHKLPSAKLSEYVDKLNPRAVSRREIGNSDSAETAGMIELNVLGENLSDVFPGETVQECPPLVILTSAQNSAVPRNQSEVLCETVQESPLSVISASAQNSAISKNQSEVLHETSQESPLSAISASAQNSVISKNQMEVLCETVQGCPRSVISPSVQNSAISKNQTEVLCEAIQESHLWVISTSAQNSAISNQSEVLCGGEMKLRSSKTDSTAASSVKTCEKAICKKDETLLSVINVSKLSTDNDQLISDNEILPKDSRRQTGPSSQDYGRVGDDVGGGPDREDMSMSHPGNSQQGSQVIPDEAGNLRILVRKTKPLLGIAIEGGANTRHPLPRIININENGAAYDAGGLQVGQLILEVDGQKVEGMHHQEVARLIAESFAQRDKPHIEFLVVEAKKSNLEPKPTALIFLEA